MEFTNLPHFHPITAVTHINYRLAGSVPRAKLAELEEERQTALRQLEEKLVGVAPEVAEEVRRRQHFLINGKLEMSVDGFLDTAANGPYHLKQPKCAEIVLESLNFLEQDEAVKVFATCVMSNHVHLLVGCPPSLEVLRLDTLMRRHKTHTARAANTLLGRTGQPFWESNYFDRYVRPGKFRQVLMYVLNNPVAAGLIRDWQAWPFTYLCEELR